MRNLFSSLTPQGVSFQTADAGAGGGGNSQGGQQGSGSQGFSGSGSHGSGTQAGSAPVAYSDDLQITHEGKTTSMKDFIGSRYVPKADYDNVRNLTKQQIEQGIRSLASKLNISKQQAQQMVSQQQQQQTDPLAGVRDLPLLDGKTFTEALQGSLGPVAQAVAQMQQTIKQQQQQLQKLGAGVGVLGKDRASQERTGRINSAITALGEGFDAKDPFLQDIAQDVLDAWDFGDKPEDFNKMLADRLTAAERWVRAKDKRALEVAKTRRFVRPGGQGNPSGAATPFKNQKFAAKEAADMLFGSASAART